MIGSELESSGWRQGSVVNPQDLLGLLSQHELVIDEDTYLIVASQSCDIAHHDLDADPYIELSIARTITKLDGQRTHNKNPRVLHTKLSTRTGDSRVSAERLVALRAFEKISVPKKAFKGLQPDSDIILEDPELTGYSAWLAARYSRPALPTKFNDLIAQADPKGKPRDKAKKGNEALSGIYVEVTPDAEIEDGEVYEVNLLGLLPAGFDGDTLKADNAIKAYSDVLKSAGMSVSHAVRREDDISIAVIRRFKRFFLDDLSFKRDSPHPPETKVII